MKMLPRRLRRSLATPGRDGAAEPILQPRPKRHRDRRASLDPDRGAPPRRPDLDGGELRLPRARPRGRREPQPAAEAGRVRGVPVPRHAVPALRQGDRAAARGRAGHLRRTRLRHHPARTSGSCRCRSCSSASRHARRFGRSSWPRARASCCTRSSTDASTPASRCSASSGASSAAWRTTSSRAAVRASIVRELSNVKQEIINFRAVIRPQRAVFRALERAKQRYLTRGARHLLRRPDRCLRAHLGRARELQEIVAGLESTNESVLSHRLNDGLRVLDRGQRHPAAAHPARHACSA